MLDTVQQRNTHLQAIEKARGSSVLAYVLHDNAMIADDAVPQIYDKLQAWGHRERIDLLLYARNGIGESVWRVLNLLRDNCDHLGLIIGTRVQGSAALLALGADEIVTGPLSELGSIETPYKHSLLPRDEAGQPVATTWSEVEWLLHRTGDAKDAPAAATPSIYDYVHPLAIAHLHQANLLSRELSRKALEMHTAPEDEASIERIVDAFNGGFHSPIYTAGYSELHDLGLPVMRADDRLWRHIWDVVQLYQAALYNDRNDPAMQGAMYRYICLIETVGRSTGLRQVFTRSEGVEHILQVGWETAIKGPGPGPSIGPGGLSNN